MKANHLSGAGASYTSIMTTSLFFLQDELEMLEEQFTEEKKQLKDLEEKLEVMALSYYIP